jgi:hypothetical protein
MTLQSKKLQVCQKTSDFADEVCSATEIFSCRFAFLVDQLNGLENRSVYAAQLDGYHEKLDSRLAPRLLSQLSLCRRAMGMTYGETCINPDRRMNTGDLSGRSVWIY